MFRSKSILNIAILLVSACQSNQNCEHKDLSVPYQNAISRSVVALVVKKNGQLENRCSGVAISKRIILTAKSCILGQNGENHLYVKFHHSKATVRAKWVLSSVNENLSVIISDKDMSREFQEFRPAKTGHLDLLSTSGSFLNVSYNAQTSLLEFHNIRNIVSAYEYRSAGTGEYLLTGDKRINPFSIGGGLFSSRNGKLLGILVGASHENKKTFAYPGSYFDWLDRALLNSKLIFNFNKLPMSQIDSNRIVMGSDSFKLLID